MPLATSHVWALLFGTVLLACTVCRAEFVEFEDESNLPHFAATGFRRSLLQVQTAVKTVTVGYSAKAQFRVPVGAADALPWFNSAMNQVVKNGGGVLLIDAGTYIFKNQWFLKSSNMKIQGAGIGKTILKLADNAAKWNGIGLISGTSLNSVTISYLTLDGNKAKQPNDEIMSYGRYGVFISPNSNLRLNYIAVLNFQKYGIDPPARNVVPGTDYTKDFRKKFTITVTNCIASGNNYDGFIFDTVQGLYAANNTASNNGRYGFNLCTGTWNAIVENNRVSNNGFGAATPNWMFLGGNGCGLMVDSNELNGAMYVSTNVVLRRNVVTGSTRGGFCGKLGKNVTVDSNVITGANQCAWFSEMNGIRFTNNKCVKTTNKIVDGGKNQGFVRAGNTCDGVPC